ncbi:MAG: GNAT family N-acetyltransferase [Bacteroidota bacterium]
MKVISNPNQIDRKEWSDFIANHPNGNIFQTPEMFDVYKDTCNFEPIFVSIIEDNKIEAILLAVIQKENYGTLSFLTARAIINGGPIFNIDKPNLLDSILNEYNKLIKNKVIYSQIRNFWICKEEEATFKKYGFIFEDHLNIINDLTISNEDQWSNLSRKRRRGIVKAKEHEFVIETPNVNLALSKFFELLTNLYSRVKLPFPSLQYFENVVNIFDQTSQVIIFNLKNKDEVLISFLGLLHKKTIFGVWVAHTDDDFVKTTKAMDLFFWEIMNWGSLNGYEKFDWMGAGKPDKDYGVRDFKLQFGGELLNLGRFEKVHSRLLFKLGKVGLKIWQKLK